MSLPAYDLRRGALTTAVIETEDLDLILREIGQLWGHAQQTFLAIGRYLHLARAAIIERVVPANGTTTVRERELLVAREFRAAVLSRLPFSNAVAHQLESVARAIFVQKRLAQEEIPNSYSVAYQLTTLTDQQLTDARNEGLLRPDIRRESIISLKRGMLAREDDHEAYRQLIDRQSKLQATISRAQAELREVETKLNKLNTRSRIKDAELA